MVLILYFFPLIWTFVRPSEIYDLLSTTNDLFEQFYAGNDSRIELNELQLMVKRTYNLNHVQKVNKRSINELDNLDQNNEGIYLLSKIEDVAKIPAKFPNDIITLPSQNLLYIITLEANGNNPESHLANDMVVYQYSSLQGIKEMGRVSASGGITLAVHTYKNETYIIAAEHDAKNSLNSFQGSALYKMIEKNKKIYLEKIQIFNVVEPNDVKFLEYGDQWFMVIGSNRGTDTLKTRISVYKWMGEHFDCIQNIPSKIVKSIELFTINSFFYMAVANYQDEHGMTDVESTVYRFYLADMKFHVFQNLKTKGAHHIIHFKFENTTLKKTENFLAVANHLGQSSTGALTTHLESVIYKFDKDYFIPFQSFKLRGVTKWLPVQGSRGEFLLLVAYSNGIRGYQYDGWRFSQVSLQFGQSHWGTNLQSMRAFQFFGDIFLTISDKNSNGDNVNLWKMSFTVRNFFEEQLKELETWCQSMKSEIDGDNFTYVIDSLSLEIPENLFNSTENLRSEISEKNYLKEEVEELSDKVKNIDTMLSEIEKFVESEKDNEELEIIFGNKEIPNLEIKCSNENCVNFHNLKISKLNGENFSTFLDNVVLLDEYFTDTVAHFDHVKIEKDFSSSTVNGHLSPTLFDTSSSNFANTEFSVHGTLSINGHLNVSGFFDGIIPTKSNILLNKDNQDFNGKLMTNVLKVNNLKLNGSLNGIPIKNLFRKATPDFHNKFKELRVNNMIVEGLVNGYNISEYFEEAFRKLETSTIQGDVVFDKLEVDEVIINSNKIINGTNSEKIQLNSCKKQSIRGNTDPEDSLPKSTEDVNFNQRANNFRANEFSNVTYFIIVVEGFLESTDISDNYNLTSLKDIFTHSYELDSPVLDFEVEFSDVVAKDLQAKMIGNVPTDSWISRESNEIQRIRGKKTFLDSVLVEEEVIAEKINGIYLNELKKDILKLYKNEHILDNFTFDSVNCEAISTNFTNFGNQLLNNLNRLSIKKSVRLEQLQTNSLEVLGKINNISWEDIVSDSVYKPDDIVSSTKIIKDTIKIHNFNITGEINGILAEDFIMLGSKGGSKIVLDKDVEVGNLLNVDELLFEGVIDSILRPNFETEWLLQNETQIIRSPFIIKNVIAESGSVLSNEKINGVSLKKLFRKSIKINNDTKLNKLITFGKVNANIIDIGGKLNGAKFNESIMRSKGLKKQYVDGEWFFEEGLIVNGSLIIENLVSGLNLSYLCESNALKNFNLIVKGSLKLQNEPSINFNVNNINISEKKQKVWLANENVSLKGKEQKIQKMTFYNNTALKGSLNNKNLTHISTHYFSKTLGRVVSSNLEFSQLVIEKGCRMRTTNVEGTVNGIELAHWIKKILLQNEDQTIEGNLRFEIFKTSNLELNGTINGINLSKDILRFDSKNSVVEGEKTFDSVNILNLKTGEGTLIQGVDVDFWKKNFIPNSENILMKGNITFAKATLRKPMTVLGKVNDFKFDSKHLLTTKGDQVITGIKNFNLSSLLDASMKIKILEISGPVSEVELDSLLTNQAYSNRQMSFSKHQIFTNGLSADTVEVEGFFQGINVSNICDDIFNPIDTNEAKKNYDELIKKTKTLNQVAQDRAYFFDYFELIQILKPNVNAVVPTKESQQNYMIAVVTHQTMKFLDWEEYSENFVDTNLDLKLNDNITFISSEINKDNSIFYVENMTSAKVFLSDSVQEIEIKNTSCITSFWLNSVKQNCIFVGQKWNSSRILCRGGTKEDLRTYQILDSKGSVQATALNINDEVYLAIINKEEVVDKIENTLSIYKFNSGLQQFELTHTLAEVNPVAVSSIAYKNDYYLVSAGGHLPESMHNSVLSIFRFHKNHKFFIRSQSIHVDTPVDVHFALLPSSQLALYVLTSNPTKPFIVFLKKGISGFVEETTGLSLYPGSSISSFTDLKDRHFVVISGFGKGQILKAGFKGEKTSK